MVAKETTETHCVPCWTRVRRVLMFRHPELRLRIHASVVPGSCFWVVNVLIRTVVMRLHVRHRAIRKQYVLTWCPLLSDIHVLVRADTPLWVRIVSMSMSVEITIHVMILATPLERVLTITHHWMVTRVHAARDTSQKK